MKHLTVVVAVAALSFATACAKNYAGSPSSPTSNAPTSAPSVSGATISGSVNGGGSSARSRDLASGSSMTVSVVGSNVSALVVAGRFRLDGVPAGNVTLQFSGSGASATVAIGHVADHDRVEVQVEMNGNNATLDAAEDIADDDSAEISGAISSMDSSSRTIQVGSFSVQVPAGAAIVSRGNSLGFSAFAVGQRVEVKGAVQGSIVVAQRVQLDDAADVPEQFETEFGAAVSSVSGDCPALSFSAAGKMVMTNSLTEFKNISCDAVKAGVMVDVKGTVQADGSVSASRVQADGGSGK
jgi:hypothetical protein